VANRDGAMSAAHEPAESAAPRTPIFPVSRRKKNVTPYEEVIDRGKSRWSDVRGA